MKGRRRAVIAIILGIMAYVSATVAAQSGELIYTEIQNTHKYRNQIKITNITETNKVHLGTQIGVTCYFESTVSKQEDHLVLFSRFTDFSLDEMKRQVRIEENESREIGPQDLTFMSNMFQRHLYDKWIQLTFAKDGTIRNRQYAEGLEEAEPISFLRLADQLIIPLPDGELQVGQRWEADYVATVALTEDAQYFISKARYTYLGTSLEKGIPCHKISVNFTMTREVPAKDTLQESSWTTYTGHGMIHLATNGSYMVKSEMVSDLSFLMIMEADEKGNFVNFIRSKVEQNIDLLTDTP